MPLDPQIQAMLDQAAAAAPEAVPLSELPPETARAGFRASVLASLGDPYQPLPLAEARDAVLDGVPVRIYRPHTEGPGLPGGAAGLPVVAFAHAGGWVIGDLETHDEVCRHLSRELPALVVAVDYRLAPEHPYPAAIDDYWTVVRHLAAHAADHGGDPDRLAVVGDSAGGNLAAAAALRARAAGGPGIAVQALAYPTVDATLEYGARPGNSFTTRPEGYGLTVTSMHWFVDSYLPDPATRTGPDASPLLVEDLENLPPAIVATAGYDPLHSEGAHYAHRLAEAGVPVTHQHNESLIHGFLWHTQISKAAEEARTTFTTALRTALTT